MVSASTTYMSHQVMSIEDMWQGILAGNASMQRMLYMHTYKTMMSLCCRYATNAEDAEQWVNDGYVKVFTNSNKFDGKGSLEGWIKRIMVNTCLDNLRKLKAQYNAPHLYTKETTAIGHDFSTVNDAINNINAKELLNVIQQLPDTQRMVFNMYAIEGFSHKEIAQQLGLKEANSQWHLNQARNFLKNKLNKFNPSTDKKQVSDEY
jgi:RNA polymerase sigma factor (sigma-70 family)